MRNHYMKWEFIGFKSSRDQTINTRTKVRPKKLQTIPPQQCKTIFLISNSGSGYFVCRNRNHRLPIILSKPTKILLIHSAELTWYDSYLSILVLTVAYSGYTLPLSMLIPQYLFSIFFILIAKWAWLRDRSWIESKTWQFEGDRQPSIINTELSNVDYKNAQFSTNLR